MTDYIKPPATHGIMPHAKPELDGSEMGDSWRTATQAVNTQLTAQAAQIAALEATDGLTDTITLAASATTDGMDITVTVKDGAGTTIAAPHRVELWISDAATGIGLSAETISGDLTATTGAILDALTVKKHWIVTTAATGIFAGTLVAASNPATIYVAVARPSGLIAVSEVSGTNWEGV